MSGSVLSMNEEGNVVWLNPPSDLDEDIPAFLIQIRG